MTLSELEQIVYIKNEIVVLTNRLKNCTGDKFVADYAKDYSSGFERVITLQGFAINDEGKIAKITNMLEKRKSEMEDKIVDAELFIHSITDSKIRTLLMLRFLDGYEWEDVGKRCYKKMTADAARKQVTRFFDKL